MRIQNATYRLHDGSDLTVEYDAYAPCIDCGLPVVAASMGGTVVCPWCDCGKDRQGRYLPMRLKGESWRAADGVTQ